MTAFYHVQSATMNPCALTKDAIARAQGSWLCPGCGAPKPGVAAVDTQVDSEPANGSPLNFVNGTGVPLAKKSFLFRLGLDVLRRQLYLGKVIGASGTLLSDWVSFRGRQRVIIRGSSLDAKGFGYARFVREGQFRSWWRGADSFVDQARRQVQAARVTPIQWHFAEAAAAHATRNLFQSRGVVGIEVIFTP